MVQLEIDSIVASVKSVTFGYPPDPLANPILENVSLHIEHRDFLGVVGPNGGGKTTLLKILLGLLVPQSGEVLVLGRSPVVSRKRIGYVPQHAMIDHSVPADVLDVVLMGRLSRSPWGYRFCRQDIEAARSALDQTDTLIFAKRAIGTLSGGQRQRVLIARALASEAELLLLDEPTAGVDAHMERGLIDLLHQLNEKLPIVMISHDVAFVSAHLKRIACLNRTLTVHDAKDITDDTVADMYHADVQAVRHDHDCAHADIEEANTQTEM